MFNLKKRKILFFTFSLFFFFVGSFSFNNQTLAKEKQNKTDFYFFYSKTCPHCLAEKSFLETLKAKYQTLEIKELIFSKNHELATEFYKKYNVPTEAYGRIPISFIGEKYFLGYDKEETSGKEIEEYIIALIEGNNNSQKPASTTPIRDKVSFFGWRINISDLSPLPLAIILGTLDGFNACAMMALIFLLATLIATKNRKRLILIGGTFILVSGIVYFFFISAWLNLFLISKHLSAISLAVGIVIIIFAIFILKDYFYGIICRLCTIKPRKGDIATRSQKKLLAKMQKLINSKSPLPLVLLGVAIVAVGINSVELVCSFGFPLAFTKILSNLQLSTFSYYSYLLVYIFFYMIDDFLVFLVAVFTLRISEISEKYLKKIKLISGITLLLLGIIIIFKPEILIFI